MVNSEKLEEKVVSDEEKKKSNEQTTDKGKAIVNHPSIEHIPYLHAPSKKDKERKYMRYIYIFLNNLIVLSWGPFAYKT